MTDLQAAIGLAQLRKLHEIIRRKNEILEAYRYELRKTEEVQYLKLEPGSTYVPFRVVLFVRDSPALMKYLEERGIQSRSFFYPLHKQPCFASMDLRNGGPADLRDELFPNSSHGYRHGLCLPVYPSLTDSDIHYICKCIRDFFSDERSTLL
jgi:perosamine synthetase